MPTRKPRKSRPGEVICRCGSYDFPHRMTGGACSGSHIPEEYFYGPLCRECVYLDDADGRRVCQVIEGAEKVTECAEWQETIRSNEVRLYGPKYWRIQYEFNGRY